MANFKSVNALIETIDPLIKDGMSKKEVLELVKGLLLISSTQNVNLIQAKVKRCSFAFKRLQNQSLFASPTKVIKQMETAFNTSHTTAWRDCSTCELTSDYIDFSKLE